MRIDIDTDSQTRRFVDACMCGCAETRTHRCVDANTRVPR